MLRWLSFADGSRPEGDQYLGAVVIDAPDFITAIRMTHILGINPGGECVEMPADPKRLAKGFPADKRERLMSPDEVRSMFDDLITIADIEEMGRP